MVRLELDQPDRFRHPCGLSALQFLSMVLHVEQHPPLDMLCMGVAEKRKMAAHAEDCRAAGVHFIPLVLESVGGWGRNLTKTVKSLGCLQAQLLGSEPAEATCHLGQMVSISIWRGNAALWTAQQPSVLATVDGLL